MSEGQFGKYECWFGENINELSERPGVKMVSPICLVCINTWLLFCYSYGNSSNQTVAKWKWIRYVLFPHGENVDGIELESVFLNTQTQQSLHRLKSLSHRKRTLPQQILTGRTPEEHGYLFRQTVQLN